MTWSRIYAFICEHAPAFPKECKPVPRADIEACEQGLGIRLPEMYVELLATMGSESGSYHPFGKDQDHDFYALVEQTSFAVYPTDRYFKVARQIDDSAEVLEEPYLDLGRAAGDDTPLVTIHEAGPFDPEHVQDLRRSLAEALTSSAFTTFVLDRRPHKAGVSASARSADAMPALRDQAVARIQALGLTLSLPLLPRLVCLANDELAALVEVHGEWGTALAIDVAGTDQTTVRVAAEILADALPGASLLRRGMRIEND